MSVMETAPERLALILRDSDPTIRGAYWQWQHDLDVLDRPAWLIEDQSGEYTVQGPSAQNADYFTETYVCQFFGMLFNMGERGVYEAAMKSAIRNAIRHLIQHRRLQFSNQRGLEGVTPLPALAYVQTITVRRGQASLMTTGGEGETRAFWGSRLDVTVTGGVGYDEVIVART